MSNDALPYLTLGSLIVILVVEIIVRPVWDWIFKTLTSKVYLRVGVYIVSILLALFFLIFFLASGGK